jgi:hypothetical protein
MPDSELEELIARDTQIRADLVGWADKELPGFDLEVDANPTEIGFCAECFSAIEEPSEAYLAWDEVKGRWLLHCAQHQPREYWRHWKGK